MSKTLVGVNDAKAIHKQSAFLAVESAKKSYWSKKFSTLSPEGNAPIHILTELENDAGEKITYDLNVQLKNEGTEGDDVTEGTEEALSFYSDSIYIDQLRKGVNAGGRMARKRTIHDLRKVGRARLSDWWGRLFDEMIFIYMSGSRGVNADYILRLGYGGFAGNPLQAPDANHLVYGGDATSKATLDASDKMKISLIDRLVTKADTQGGGIVEGAELQPIMVDGEKHFVLAMHTWQFHDLKTDTGATGWLELQKAAAAAQGADSPIFKGREGLYNNVVLHKHKSIIKFNDYGAGGNVTAARALFMGAQAGSMAFGSEGNGLTRFSWGEETDDRGNQLIITTNSIFGVKKNRFNTEDFGLFSVDTAAADPG